MLPPDPWDKNSSGGQSSPSREDARPTSGNPFTIDRLAVLFAPGQRPEELDRDLKLNHIVEQACLATGATGAAIALARGDEFICRASTGNAPDLGMRLSIDHGLSAFCVQTGEVQRCDDSEVDSRVDAEVCRHLGVRSVLVVPITYGDFFLGIFEIFAPQPFAFYDRDIETVLALCKSVLTALGISAPVEDLPDPRVSLAEEPFEDDEPGFSLIEPPALTVETAKPAMVAPAIIEPEIVRPAQATSRPRTLAQEIRAENDELDARSEPEQLSYPQFKIVEKQGLDYWTAILTALVVSLALLLGWMIGKGRTRKDAAQDSQAAVSAQPTPKPGVPEEIEIAAAPVAPKSKRSPFASKAPPPDGLVVYQDGKIVYRQGLSPRNIRSVRETSSSPPELDPEVAGGLVSLRVEPRYPDRARQAGVQGPVVLQALINDDGRVQQLKVLTGNPDLAMAAIDAVRRWRFKPYFMKGKQSAFSTRITVNFALPG
ncbi:MAG TPA: TonB family protein [Terriglobales bacterium]|nr:TonB family protein [Terriglobales bacterium]